MGGFTEPLCRGGPEHRRTSPSRHFPITIPTKAFQIYVLFGRCKIGKLHQLGTCLLKVTIRGMGAAAGSLLRSGCSYAVEADETCGPASMHSCGAVASWATKCLKSSQTWKMASLRSRRSRGLRIRHMNLEHLRFTFTPHQKPSVQFWLHMPAVMLCVPTKHLLGL